MAVRQQSQGANKGEMFGSVAIDWRERPMAQSPAFDERIRRVGRHEVWLVAIWQREEGTLEDVTDDPSSGRRTSSQGMFSETNDRTGYQRRYPSLASVWRPQASTPATRKSVTDCRSVRRCQPYWVPLSPDIDVTKGDGMSFQA